MRIRYDGIGSNNVEEHTEKEFLDIMKKEFINRNWNEAFKYIPREFHYQCHFKDWVLPDDFIFFTLVDWIEYSGAEIIL